MLRVVVDPGVLIAALVSPRGAPAKLLLRWLEGRLQLIVSPQLLAELETVLLRPKFRPYISEEEARSFVLLLFTAAPFVPDPPTGPGLTPDPGDDYLIALARAGGADFLVSGDTHLTGLQRMRPPVITPRVCLDRLEGG